VDSKGRRKKKEGGKQEKEGLGKLRTHEVFYEHLARSPAQLLMNFNDYYIVVKKSLHGLTCTLMKKSCCMRIGL